jgi:hypothetical protein
MINNPQRSRVWLSVQRMLWFYRAWERVQTSDSWILSPSTNSYFITYCLIIRNTFFSINETLIFTKYQFLRKNLIYSVLRNWDIELLNLTLCARPPRKSERQAFHFSWALARACVSLTMILKNIF